MQLFKLTKSVRRITQSEDKSGFELIERPSSYPSSSESVITMWVLFERNKEPDLYNIKDKFFNDENYVYDLKIRLQKKFTVFKNVQEVGKIEIYVFSDSGQH